MNIRTIAQLAVALAAIAAVSPAVAQNYDTRIFNVAVGGNFPGNPDASTVFPATMEVDWVRVYSGEP